MPSEDRRAKTLDLAEVWQHSELGRYYPAGKRPPSNVMFKSEEEVCETPAQYLAVAALPLAGTAASLELNATLGMLKHQQKNKAPGIIVKHNTNAVKNTAATQAFPGDNVDEGSNPEPPPAKKAKQPAEPAAGVPAPGAGAVLGPTSPGGGPVRIAGRPMAVAAAATRDQQALRHGDPGRNRM
eukprot:jgi/Tetstr1/441286/TSEL_029537.t1